VTRPENQLSRCKDVVIGNVTYKINVNGENGGMFRATWTCSNCNEKGAWSPVSSDAKQAVELAKIGMEIHHSLLHSSGHIRQSRRVS
jgi:hypothetical protein